MAGASSVISRQLPGWNCRNMVTHQGRGTSDGDLGLLKGLLANPAADMKPCLSGSILQLASKLIAFLVDRGDNGPSRKTKAD
jgi:hypothetical protein